MQADSAICVLVYGGASDKLPTFKKGATLYYEQTVPSRIYKAEELARLSNISSVIKCECPKRLSNLVKDLVSFETYSAECESDNPNDAAMHNYLHATTAQARSLLEEAISHLLKLEGI